MPETFRVAPVGSVDQLRRELNDILRQLSKVVSQQSGSLGAATHDHADKNMGGHRVTNISPSQSDSDAVNQGQMNQLAADVQDQLDALQSDMASITGQPTSTVTKANKVKRIKNPIPKLPRQKKQIQLTAIFDPTLPDPTSMAAVETKKMNLRLSWSYPFPRPLNFKHFAIYIGNAFASATLIDTSKQTQYLIHDVAKVYPGTNTFWVAAVSLSGALDPNPASVTFITGQPYKKDWTQYWSGLTDDPLDANHYAVAANPTGSSPTTTTAYLPALTNDWDLAFNVETVDGGGSQGLDVYYLLGPSGNGYRIRMPMNALFLGRISTWNGSVFTVIASSGTPLANASPGSYAVIIKRHLTGHMEFYINGVMVVQVLDTTYSPTNLYIDSAVTTPTVINSWSTGSSTAVASVSIPTNVGSPMAVGDILILAVSWYQSGRTVSPPDATWQTAIPLTYATQGDLNLAIAIFWKAATASDVNATFTVTSNGGNSFITAGITAIRSANPTTPFDVIGTIGSGNTNAPTAPSITLVTPKSMVLWWVNSGVSAGSGAVPASFTQAFNVGPPPETGILGHLDNQSAGATGAQAGSETNVYWWLAVMLAIKPAPIYVSDVKVTAGHAHTPRLHKAPTKFPVMHDERAWTGLTYDPVAGDRFSPANRNTTAPVTGTASVNNYGGDWEVSFQAEFGGAGSLELFHGTGSPGNGYLYRIFQGSTNNVMVQSWNGTAYTTLVQASLTINAGSTYNIIYKRHGTGHHEIYVNGAIIVTILDTTFTPTGQLFLMYNFSVGYLSNIVVRGGHSDTPNLHKAPNKFPKQHDFNMWTGLTYDVPSGNKASPGTYPGAPSSTTQYNQNLNNDWELSLQVDMGAATNFQVFYGTATPGNGYAFLFETGASTSFLLMSYNGTAYTTLASSASGFGAGSYNIIVKFHHTGHMEMYIKGILVASAKDTTYTPQNLFLMYQGNVPLVHNIVVRGGHFDTPSLLKNSSKQIIDDGLDPNAVTNRGDNTASPAATFGAQVNLWSTSTSPPSGIWAAAGGQPSPSLVSTTLTVKLATDYIIGHIELDATYSSMSTGSQVWLQIENGTSVVWGPNKLNIVAMTNTTSVDTNKTATSVKFTDSAGANTYTLQIAVFSTAAPNTVKVNFVRLNLMDQKK